MKSVTTAAALPDATPQSVFAALERLVQETLKVKLFTVMESDPGRGVARRSYSNMPEAYPVSGEKPTDPNRWTEVVHDRGETFVANTIEEIAEVFPDHELIRSLGCESVLNLPIILGGEVLGTMNCLDVAGYFTPEKIAAAETLKPAGTLALLCARYLRPNRS